MIRPALATLAVLAAAPFGMAQGSSTLFGRVEGDTYLLGNGAFKIEIPVLAKLGGTITDTKDVVTFEDTYSTHISIAAFPQDATQRWELSTRGSKDYLIYFFSNFVLRDFKQAYQGVTVENTYEFLPGLFDGGLITFVLMPGGSMFADKVPVVTADQKPPVAKRGNLLFVKNGFIYVISIELAERVLEGSAYRKTSAEENAILHRRLLDVTGKIAFAIPAPPPPAPPAATAGK